MVRKTYFRKNLRRQPKHLLIIPSPPIFSKSKFRCDLTNGSGRRVQTHLWLWVFKKDSKSSLCKDLDNHQGLTSLEINLFLQGKKITGIRILIAVLDSRKEWRIFTDIWEESTAKLESTPSRDLIYICGLRVGTGWCTRIQTVHHSWAFYMVSTWRSAPLKWKLNKRKYLKVEDIVYEN